MKYQVGQRVNGIINNITDLGIFLTLPGRKSGLIHHSDFGNDWPRERNLYQVGDQLRVVVLHHYKGRLSLSKMRVNDPDLVDHTNRFSSVKAAEFANVLNQTANDAKEEIKTLEENLNKFKQ